VILPLYVDDLFLTGDEKVCGTLMMAVILQLSLCLYELQWIMINVDDCLLPKNVMSPKATGFHNGVHLFVVIKVLTNNI
jgi:hypothetical protein